MKRPLIVALAVSAVAVLVLGRKRLRCWARGWHIPKRQFIGGSRCEECRAALDAEYLDKRFLRRTG